MAASFGADNSGGGLDKDTADNGEVKATGTAITEQEIHICKVGDAGATCNKSSSDTATVRNVRDAKQGNKDFRPFSVGDLLYVGTVACCQLVKAELMAQQPQDAKCLA